MMGLELETSVFGHVDSGLGKRVITGSTSIAKPNIEISKSEEALIIDGINFIFFNMPESEAPAELTFYLPEKRVFCGAEIVSRTMHNVLTLRGAKVRDAFKWSEYIAFIRERLPDVETLFISHHWPTWGHNEIVQQLEEQQDLYRFIHDQTLRLANKGLTPREIAEELSLPPNLARAAHVQGYYGTLSHNAKAVYQYYFGWYEQDKLLIYGCTCVIWFRRTQTRSCQNSFRFALTNYPTLSNSIAFSFFASLACTFSL